MFVHCTDSDLGFRLRHTSMHKPNQNHTKAKHSGAQQTMHEATTDHQLLSTFKNFQFSTKAVLLSSVVHLSSRIK